MKAWRLTGIGVGADADVYVDICGELVGVTRAVYHPTVSNRVVLEVDPVALRQLLDSLESADRDTPDGQNPQAD